MYGDSSARSESRMLALVCYSLNNYSWELTKQIILLGDCHQNRFTVLLKPVHFLWAALVALKTKLAGLLKLCIEREKRVNQQSFSKVKPRISEIHHTVLFLTSVLFKIVVWGPEYDMKNYADRGECWLRWMTVSDCLLADFLQNISRHCFRI